MVLTAVQSLCLNTAIVTISGLQSTLRHLYDKDLLLYRRGKHVTNTHCIRANGIVYIVFLQSKNGRGLVAIRYM